MKFKVGDKVKHKDFGVGKIVYIHEGRTAMPYAVQFKIFNNEMWCEEGNLELDKQQSHNLIPQIAKMLGVEIGEEFYIKGWSSFKHKFENGTLMSRTNGNLYEEADYKTWVHLIKGNYQNIVKLPKTPLLTEDEKVILGNLPKVYKWIERDKEGLYCYKSLEIGNPAFAERLIYDHLFQFIKWEDEEPYNIKELLEE